MCVSDAFGLGGRGGVGHMNSGGAESELSGECVGLDASVRSSSSRTGVRDLDVGERPRVLFDCFVLARGAELEDDPPPDCFEFARGAEPENDPPYDELELDERGLRCDEICESPCL